MTLELEFGHHSEASGCVGAESRIVFVFYPALHVEEMHLCVLLSHWCRELALEIYIHRNPSCTRRFAQHDVRPFDVGDGCPRVVKKRGVLYRPGDNSWRQMLGPFLVRNSDEGA